MARGHVERPGFDRVIDFWRRVYQPLEHRRVARVAIIIVIQDSPHGRPGGPGGLGRRYPVPVTHRHHDHVLGGLHVVHQRLPEGIHVLVAFGVLGVPVNLKGDRLPFFTGENIEELGEPAAVEIQGRVALEKNRLRGLAPHRGNLLVPGRARIEQAAAHLEVAAERVLSPEPADELLLLRKRRKVFIADLYRAYRTR